MKKIILLSAMASSMLLATNGDNLISLGAESRAMGGTGIAMGMGTDSVFKNPAWLADVKGTEAMFGATLFMPDVKSTVGQNMGGTGVEATSEADLSLIPAVSHAGRINENLAYGIGMFGVSGMGADYRNETSGQGNMRTNFQYMRFVPSLGYQIGDLKLGAGLTLAYGVLDIAAEMGNQQYLIPSAQRSGGTSDAFGFGGQLGAAYSVTPDVSLGAYYQTEVGTEYKNVFDFNLDGKYDNLKLSQPAEYGVGIGYKKDGIALTAEVKQIEWSKADGYDAFGWDDQTVYAVGAAYDVNTALTLRAGYSQANSPIDSQFSATTVSSANAQFQPANTAFFNMMGFPAISEKHITAGFGYQFSDQIGVDLAYVYSPKETVSSTYMEVSNEQNSISGALKYKFD